jgi:hypothetical protein
MIINKIINEVVFVSYYNKYIFLQFYDNWLLLKNIISSKISRKLTSFFTNELRTN